MAGFPANTTRFTTYPEWAEIVGGVMMANGYGDPCLPFKGEYEDSGGDRRTAAMAALFQVCADDFKGVPVKNKQIFACVRRHQPFDSDQENTESDQATDQGDTESDQETVQLEALRFYGQLEGSDDAHKNQGNLMSDVRAFKNRVLGGIKLVIDEASANRKRHTYQFLRPRNPPKAQAKQGPKEASPCPHASPFSGPVEKPACNPKRDCEGNVGFTSHYASDPKNGDRWGQGDTLETEPEPPNVDVLSGHFLALDLETCAEVKVSRRGTPKITTTREALNPWKGQIRLLTLADLAGAITSFDLRADSLPDEIKAGLERCPLIVHNACFDLLS
jgi:hypothetical protein